MVPEQRLADLHRLQDGARAAVKTCTYKVCTMVPEQRCRTYTVCKMVPEQRVKSCTYTVCKMVPRAARRPAPTRSAAWSANAARKRSATRCAGWSRKSGASVYRTVCRPVQYTKTIDCVQYVAKRVPYTVTRCVPRVVCKQVPVTICCPVPCCPDPACESGCDAAVAPGCSGLLTPETRSSGSLPLFGDSKIGLVQRRGPTPQGRAVVFLAACLLALPGRARPRALSLTITLSSTGRRSFIIDRVLPGAPHVSLSAVP